MLVAVPEATYNIFLQAPIWCEAIGNLLLQLYKLSSRLAVSFFRLFGGPTNQLRDRVQTVNNRILINSAGQFFVQNVNSVSKILIFRHFVLFPRNN